MRCIRLLAAAALAAVAAVVATGPQAGAGSPSAAPPVLTRAGAGDVHGLAAPVALRCVTPTTAALTLAAAVTPGRSLAFSLSVDGRTVRSGRVVSPTGTLRVTTTVSAGRAHTAALRVSGRVVTRTAAGKGVSISCSRTPRQTAPARPAPAPAGKAASYSLHENTDGSVTRWNPCAGPISVRVNAAKAPAGGLEDARAALAQVSAATGLALTYAGATDFVPTRANERSRPADIVIAWVPRGSAPGQSDYFSGSAIGVGAWSSTGTSTDGRTWSYRISSGAVVIDPDVRLARGFGVGGTTGALLLHEIAHVMGLGHVTDPTQVMHPSLLPTTRGSFGAGDLAGLAAVGAGQGCTDAPTAARAA